MGRLLVKARFKGHEVQAHDLGRRIMVGPFPLSAAEDDSSEPFWRQLQELQEIAGWQPLFRGSLAGDLMADRECAHAFAAVNLKAMARRCAGRGWGHIWSPQQALEGLHLLLSQEVGRP